MAKASPRSSFRNQRRDALEQMDEGLGLTPQAFMLTLAILTFAIDVNPGNLELFDQIVKKPAPTLWLLLLWNQNQRGME